MQEKLLQFIWKYNLYQPHGLLTTDGQAIQVIHPGILNTHSGPDFSIAKIRIGTTIMVGNVELHLRTSDWLRHNHQYNKAYEKLVLHVVYEHDMDELPGGITVLPLKAFIPDYVLTKYTQLLQTTHPLPCARQLPGVNTLIKESWLSRLLVERWEKKLTLWKEELQQADNDWRTLLYWRMAANFGFKVNATPFLLLAQSLPLQLLGKQHQLLQIEALIFGQAGLLENDFKDDYPRQLQQEYQYLRQKYTLAGITPHLWKFMRLRPANFPTIRLAQFAALVHQSLHLFTKIGERTSLAQLKELLTVKASAYWDDHYRFDELTANQRIKNLGDDSVHNIIINTIAPIRFLYAHAQHIQDAQEAALQLLEDVPAESNNVMGLLEAHGWKPSNAGQSQSLLQLYKHYCSAKRCLECAIGLSIIKSGPDK